jgi:adenylate kinase
VRERTRAGDNAGLARQGRQPVTMLILLGAPGSGKGTQAPVLARYLGVPVLGSGDLLRTAVAAGTQLGREADRYMSRGQLVPDQTIVRVFLDRLERPDAAKGAILDGFPRTRVQAEALDVALAETGRRVDRTIFIDVPTEDLVARMANRRICTANGHVYNLASNPPRADDVCDLDGSAIVQRPDDQEETVRARMAEQIPPLLDVVDHYRRAGVLQTVDGREPITDVSALILASLDRAADGAAVAADASTTPPWGGLV